MITELPAPLGSACAFSETLTWHPRLFSVVTEARAPHVAECQQCNAYGSTKVLRELIEFLLGNCDWIIFTYRIRQRSIWAGPNTFPSPERTFNWMSWFRRVELSAALLASRFTAARIVPQPENIVIWVWHFFQSTADEPHTGTGTQHSDVAVVVTHRERRQPLAKQCMPHICAWDQEMSCSFWTARAHTHINGAHRQQKLIRMQSIVNESSVTAGGWRGGTEAGDRRLSPSSMQGSSSSERPQTAMRAAKERKSSAM